MKQKLFALLLAMTLMLPLVLASCTGELDPIKNNKETEEDVKTVEKTEEKKDETEKTEETNDSDASQADPAEDDVLNVLFIGGSSLTGFYTELNGLLRQAGVKAHLWSAYYSGSTFENHWKWSQDRLEMNYRLVHAEQSGYWNEVESKTNLEDCLSRENWDVIAIHHHYPVSHQESVAAAEKSVGIWADKIIGFLKDSFPKTKILFHQQWSNDIGHTDDTGMTATLEDQTTGYESMRQVNIDVAKRNGIGRSPNGDAWQIVRADPVFGQEALTRDKHHDGGVQGGKYLNACVWFEAITGQSCVGNSYRPTYKLSEEKIQVLQKAAHQAWEENKQK